MLDHLFLPALTFTLLVAAAAAFTAEASTDSAAPTRVEVLERVLVTVPRLATPVARDDHAATATVLR
jgi:hypothetical protein